MAILAGDAESDLLNGLVTRAAVHWTDVQILRAYRRYRQMVRREFTETYQSQVLIDHAETAALLQRLEPHSPIPYLIQRANQTQVPVLRTPQSTTPFIHSLTLYLDHMFAPQHTVHGSLVDVYGCGLLFTGRSAIGKSETALDFLAKHVG